MCASDLRPPQLAMLCCALALMLCVCSEQGQLRAADTAQQGSSVATQNAATAAEPAAPAEPAALGFDPAGLYKAGTPIDAFDRVELTSALADAERYAGRTIRLEGEVLDVCSKRGCWMMLRDGDATVRVTFKDYGFFVPRDAKGAKAVIVAQVSRETMPEEVARHFAAESEGGNPDAIKGPQSVVAVVASGVELRRAAADKPRSE
jgi:hypothetical protein